MSQFLLVSLLALLATSAKAATDKEPTCDELGFIPDQVSCSDCETLSQIVKDAGLVADCRRCCVKDQAPKFKKAELIIDQWRANSLPQIKDFIDKRAPSFGPALKVSYSYGASPKLRLTGGQEGAASETVRIDNWKADHIADFLTERLQPAAAKATGKAAKA